MIIHFICSGNSFRSRLAEAYLNSLDVPLVKSSSSGAHTYLDPYSHISTHGAVVLEHEGLTKYASPGKKQVSQTRLDSADITVCMNKSVYEQCLGEGMRMPQRTYIWDVNDIRKFTREQMRELEDNEVPQPVQTIYNSIRDHVDELVAFLKRPRPTELIDILDENGQPIGKQSDIATIHENGWWHTGAHIGLFTPKSKILLERRSQNIVFNPGLWDLSLGGAVASGETPEIAIIRELREELGIRLTTNHLNKLFVWKYNHHLPHYGYHNRNFTHTYIAEIPDDYAISLQVEEVAEAKYFNIKEVEKMNNNNHSAIESIIPTYDYNQKILQAIETKLQLG